MIEHAIRIDAPAERVWNLTVELERWPDFIPTMTRVERLDDGPVSVGSAARVTQPRQRPRTWTVTAIDPPHQFAWEARFGPATMTASHRLVADGRACVNTLSIEASGRGARALMLVLGPLLRRALAAENAGFKAAAEAAEAAEAADVAEASELSGGGGAPG